MKLSVALCTYNGSKYLTEQSESILNQSCSIDEIVIYDDNSTDGTVEILESFANRFPNKFKIYFNDKNVGAIKNFENCIHQCSGEIIFLSDQDDVWCKDKVIKILTLFNKDRNALLVFSDGALINQIGEPLLDTLWSKWGFTEEVQQEWQNNDQAFKYLVKNHNKITGATIAFKAVMKDVIFPFELPINMWHDTWLGLIAAGNDGLRFINESLIKYRVHNDQQIGIGNGISLTTGDKKFSIVTYEYFNKKVEKLFPKKSKLIYPKKPNFILKYYYRIKQFAKTSFIDS